MKKFYVLVAVLTMASAVQAQDRYWVGPSGGNWDEANNWSATSGGGGGAGVPGSGANVIFDEDADLLLNASPEISTLTVTGNSNVKITAVDVARSLMVTSTTAPALQIDAGSVLQDSATSESSFEFIFGNNTTADISGTWYFAGVDNDHTSGFILPEEDAPSTNISVKSGGAIIVGPGGYGPLAVDLPGQYLEFEAGALYDIGTSLEGGGYIPPAVYDPASTVRISGVTAQFPTIEEAFSLGNLVYDCANQSEAIILAMSAADIEGDLRILNTNGNDLIVLANNSFGGVTTISLNIKGDLEISGNSNVVLSSADDTKERHIIVEGNLLAGGNSLDIQEANFAAVTTLSVGGNIEHTAGSFGVSSTLSSNTINHFILELNGDAAQTINSVSGVFEGDELALRINNASGVTLNSPLSVGRLDLVAGILSTGANALTLSNALSDESSSMIVKVTEPPVESYVDGALRRKTEAGEGTYLFPVGRGSYAGAWVLTTETGTGSTFEASYDNTPYTGANVQSPVAGVAGYYWIINRTEGTDEAAVELPINGAVSGAGPADGMVVARYGTAWTNVKGETGTIEYGSVTSGSLRSDVLSSFSPFTIAYGSYVALPIHLVSFNAKMLSGNAALATWKITHNSTPDRFEVTHSSDGVNFTPIGSVTGVKGMLDYQFTHQQVKNGNNYYRLRMFDIDGSISLSNIVMVMNGTKGVYISSMIPTVVRDRARLNISSSLRGNMQLVVTDISGRIVQTQVVSVADGNQEVWLNAGRLASGIFHVTGYINGQRTATIRFIKQ